MKSTNTLKPGYHFELDYQYDQLAMIYRQETKAFNTTGKPASSPVLASNATTIPTPWPPWVPPGAPLGEPGPVPASSPVPASIGANFTRVAQSTPNTNTIGNATIAASASHEGGTNEGHEAFERETKEEHAEHENEDELPEGETKEHAEHEIEDTPPKGQEGETESEYAHDEKEVAGMSLTSRETQEAWHAFEEEEDKKTQERSARLETIMQSIV